MSQTAERSPSEIIAAYLAAEKEYHPIKVVKETNQAVAIAMKVEFLDLPRSDIWYQWIPRTALRDGKVPGWLLNRSIERTRQDVKDSGIRRVSVEYV